MCRFFSNLLALTPMLLVGLNSTLWSQVAAGPGPGAGIEIDEKVDAAISKDLSFVNDAGQAVKLGDYFGGKKPVLLTLNYANCPQLCGLQLNGLVTVMRELDLDFGQDFDVVTVSIDPNETFEDSARKKREYVKRIGKPEAADGWHFLTGAQAEIRHLADSVGFRYRYDERSGEYIHAAVMMLMTPDGRVSRYVYGIQFNPKDIKFSLIEASGGRVGAALDRFLLICFLSYDPESNSYGPTAMKIMRAGGVVVMLGLGTFLFTLWRRERKPVVADPGVAA